MSTVQIALDGIKRLSQNSYPGRLIVLGMDQGGENAVQLYAVMGRSPNSRNRILSANGDRVYTEAADPAKMEDPSLIIYNAMMAGQDGLSIVSNGEQTDSVADEGIGALMRYKFEPDEPNNTPRITGLSRFCRGCNALHAQLHIICKSPFDYSCVRKGYSYDSIPAGFGYGISTYMGDGNPLPSFQGEPILMPFTGDIDTIAEEYWTALNEENRVALAVKFIPSNGGGPDFRIINKFQKVG